MNTAISTYLEDARRDLYFDHTNLGEYVYKIPSIKHKWVAKYLYQKEEILNLEKELEEIKISLINLAIDESPVKITRMVAEATAKSNKKYLQQHYKIKNARIVLECLNEIMINCRNLQWDVKNMIEIQKLETL